MILLPYRFSAEDYRAILVDFKLENIAGYRVKICTLNMRRLIGNKSSVVARHNDKAKELIFFCEINRKLDTLEDKQNNFDNIEIRVKLDTIDEQVTSLLLCIEKECRKI